MYDEVSSAYLNIRLRSGQRHKRTTPLIASHTPSAANIRGRGIGKEGSETRSELTTFHTAQVNTLQGTDVAVEIIT